MNNKLYIEERNTRFPTTYPYQLETFTHSYEVHLTSFNYETVLELAQAVKLGLNTLKSGKILDAAVTYECVPNLTDPTKLEISTLHNNAAERYDFTGLYSRSDSSDKLWVVRDNTYRQLTIANHEYVAAGQFNFLRMKNPYHS